MNELSLIKTNIDTVIRHVLHQDVVLSADQEALLLRIQFADQHLRERKHTRDDIVALIVGRFGVSRWRAEQDITDAHKAFGATRKLNKTYMLSHHIDTIERQIQMAMDAKDIKSLPRLNDNLTAAINALPDSVDDKDAAPVRIVFVVKDAGPRRSIDELLKTVAAEINEPDNSVEDAEYEEQ